MYGEAGGLRRGFDPWVGKIPWRRACNPLQYSCLENPMDRGAWRATVHGVTERRTCLKQLTTQGLLAIHPKVVADNKNSEG